MIVNLVSGTQVSFHFKASFLPCMVLQILRHDLDQLAQDLNRTIQSAPNFFLGSPVIVDIEKIQGSDLLNFVKLKQILISSGLTPIGIRGGSEIQLTTAVQAGIPLLPASKMRLSDASKAKELKEKIESKLITTPVRSGMQVYAKEADLIVIAPVSQGAEILADGNIHVYGPLRGRALAGMQGNRNARIFCRMLEAELISIAGFYLTKEDIQSRVPPNGMVQIYLENTSIRISTIY